MGDYVGTLDLTRAFDHIDPQIAIDTLEWYGCPSFLTKGMALIWRRFLKWRKDVLPEGQDVRSSIPEGDGLSPRVMNLLLSATVKDIVAKEPETRVVVFMDDRSWASPTWYSFQKSQYTHKRLLRRKFMRSIDDVAPCVVDHLCALGACLGHGPPQPKETERFSKAPNLVGVLCGAFVSPEMASRMQDLSQEGCPWCKCTGETFNHVCWDCVQFPGEKPQTPDNAISKRLGWGDESVLSHLGFCRQAVLKLRWD